MRRGVFIVGVLMMHALMAGCSPGYVLRAAYEQGKILSARRPINQVLLDPQTSSEDREKLGLVLDARSFAEKCGLTPGDSFTTYSFSLHTWWFPIVGRVPYKGFFDKEDAQEELDALVKQGYEGSMRGTEAFSTLGWFNDPVLSTTLKNNPARIANTVIHESVHSTVWIPGSVAFNESLANFVGSVGGISFFNEQANACLKASRVCANEKARLEAAVRDEQVQYEVSRIVDRLYESLEKLYADPSLTSEEKIARRGGVFSEVVRPFRERYPNASILKEVSNADIIQLKLYMTKLPLFGRLYAQEHQSLPRFIDKIREVQRQVEADAAKDPFVVLEDILGDAP